LEKIMSKTNHTCNLSHDTLDDHRLLADSELDSVNGGVNGGGFLGAAAGAVVDAVFYAVVVPIIRATS
jgi:hypothetical protein